MFNVTGDKNILAPIVSLLPNLIWLHSLYAGLDHLLFDELISNSNIQVSNAKGLFSSTLAEYAIGAICYFTKQFPKLIAQKNEKLWHKFDMIEMKGKTMGIIGYGDIGKACAKLGKAFGMRIIALRRRPELSLTDNLIDKIYGNNEISEIMKESDFLILSLPLTVHTKHIINRELLLQAKIGQILINLGRGQLIDENSLIEVLQTGPIAGAALDVFSIEPLPQDSPLWNLPNVLLSPHNADHVINSTDKSVKFFTENVERFINNEELLCKVDKHSGY